MLDVLDNDIVVMKMLNEAGDDGLSIEDIQLSTSMTSDQIVRSLSVLRQRGMVRNSRRTIHNECGYDTEFFVWTSNQLDLFKRQ